MIMNMRKTPTGLKMFKPKINLNHNTYNWIFMKECLSKTTDNFISLTFYLEIRKGLAYHENASHIILEEIAGKPFKVEGHFAGVRALPETGKIEIYFSKDIRQKKTNNFVRKFTPCFQIRKFLVVILNFSTDLNQT